MILCYTLNMGENRQIWVSWARTLHRWGVNELVAFMLESAGALNVMLAQVMYLSQPLLSGAVTSGSLQKLAQVLENPAMRMEFVSFLKEASTSGTSS
jgi:hypothetical protein